MGRENGNPVIDGRQLVSHMIYTLSRRNKQTIVMNLTSRRTLISRKRDPKSWRDHQSTELVSIFNIE